jgi:PAS domain S-box-containing protein
MGAEHHEPLSGAIPRVRTQGHETLSEVAFALLDALWAGPVGLALFDPALRFLQVNDTVAEMNGLPAEDHVGRTLGELSGELAAASPAAIAGIEDAIRGVLATGRPRLNVVVPGLDGDGVGQEWLCSYYPVAAPGGGVRGVCAVMTDASDDRDGEQGLRQARDHAEAAARRLALLQQTTAALSAAVEPAEVAEVVLSRARSAIGAASTTLRVLAGGQLEVLATNGDSELTQRYRRMPMSSDAPPVVAVRRNEALWLEAPEVIRSHFPTFAAEAGGAIRGAWVLVPLAARERVLGSLGFSFDGPRTFDLEERAFVLSFAEQTAQALDRARLLQEERARGATHQRASERVARIQEVTAALSQARTVDDVASVFVLQAHTKLGADVAVAYGRVPDGLELLAALGVDPPLLGRFDRLLLDAPLPIAEVVRTGAPLWFASREEQVARFPALEGLAADPRLPGLAAVPLRCGSEVLGAVAFGFRAGRALSPGQRELLVAAADLGGQALERARLFDAEREAREAEARARALLDAVLDNAPVGIGFWDRSLRFARLNQGLAEIDGLPIEAHLGKTLREIAPGLPVEKLEELWRAVLDEGRTVMEAPITGTTPAAPGKVRHWVSTFYPVRAGGEALGIGGIVREVTAQREAEEFQRNVLGIVGHDLRNPLSAVVLAARLLERHVDASPEVRGLAERIRRAADRMDSIVAVLLDYTRVRSGQGIPIRPSECLLDALVLSVVEECAAARPGREVRTSADGDGAGRWDRDRIGQVVQNLVSNALDHGPQHEPVEVAFRGFEREVELAVRNTGPPIPPEILPRLFDPFRRAEAPQELRHQGLGLGLFIARAIVDAHGGWIAARSSGGEGTVFTVRLPRHAPAPDPE